MTCIVGMVDIVNQKVVIGGDSACSNGSNVFIREDKKALDAAECFALGVSPPFNLITTKSINT